MSTHSILLVEDDAHFGKQLVDLFQFLGYETLLAKTGEEAVAAFSAHPYDFVLCDIMLPGLSGVDVVERLRAAPGGGRIPVMLMSAVYKNPRLFEKDLRRLNVLEFLPKPFSVIDVGRKVTAVLNDLGGIESEGPDLTESGSWRAEEIRQALGDSPPRFESIGSCDRVGMLSLFIELFRAHAAGCLTLRRGRTTRAVYFLNGYPVWATSDDPEDQLGEVLVKEGLIARGDLDGLLRRAAESGQRLAERIISEGLVAERRLLLVERRRVRQTVVNCFRWGTADYSFEEGDGFVDRIGIYEVNPVTCLGEAILRFGAVNDLAPDIYPRAGQVLVRGARFRRLFPYLELPPGLRGLGGDVETGLTVGELFRRYARETEALIKFLWLMFRLGITDTMDPPPALPERLGPQRVKRTTAPRARPAPPPVTQPAPTGLVDERARAILQDYLALSEGDYYRVLGIGREAGQEEVDVAYQGRLERYRLSTLSDQVDPEVRRKAKELLVRTVDAYEVLSNRTRRAEYDSGLSDAPVQGETIGLLSSARDLMKEERWTEALPLLRSLRNRHPQSPQILAALGRSLAEADPTAAEEARALLDRAVELDPYLRQAHRWLADLCRRMGDEEGYRSAVQQLRNIGSEESWVARSEDLP